MTHSECRAQKYQIIFATRRNIPEKPGSVALSSQCASALLRLKFKKSTACTNAANQEDCNEEDLSRFSVSHRVSRVLRASVCRRR
jgi:hypothetical protein